MSPTKYTPPDRVATVFGHEIVFDDDVCIEAIRVLLDVGHGLLTVTIETVREIFGVIDDSFEKQEELVDAVMPLIHQPHIIRQLRDCQGDSVVELCKKDDESWFIRPINGVPMMDLSNAPPSSIAAEEVLPLYPGCRTVLEAHMTVVREIEIRCYAEVKVLDETVRYFFKHVNRKGKNTTLAEVSALATLHHPHIVPLSAIVLDSSGAVVGLLFPFAERGSLKELSNQSEANARKLRWVADIVDALLYIATCHLEYWDIKASNVVVFDDGDARLTDFDGGWTKGHFQEGYDCFGLGVLLEDLKCEGPGVEELVRLAKTTKLSLCQFKDSLVAIRVS
ncbi:hypothetical protein BD410DRAFT_825713 [Rickenella mellea]|uniref:Protein kinase domain-containing protein n=1 Tax=Rickenella mellea TaxID=50990 RepID=A0A4Y7QGU8_9AGAM|nr:hypothetical protein BD410DRAFT_825713 [Rickenella mellea]